MATMATTTSFPEDQRSAESIPEDKRSPASIPEGKRRFLFALLPPAVQDELQLDDVAGYSVTDAVTARQITKLILRLPGVDSRTTVCDATACVGGNTLSFALHGFQRVVAVENDATRFQLLRHNLDVVRRHIDGHGASFGEVIALQGSCVAMALQEAASGGSASAVRGAAVLFLDPPWGGLGYRKASKIELQLDGTPLVSLCQRLDRSRNH